MSEYQRKRDFPPEPPTLAEFLIWRIEEDEERNVHATGCPYGTSEGVDDCACGEGSRNRAECEAKRLLVEWYGDTVPDSDTLKALATVYANHPAHREEWRP